MCLFQWWIKIFWGGGWGLVVFEMPRFSLRASLFKAKCWFLAGSCKSREMKPTNPQHMKHNVCIVIFTHRGSEGMSITVFFLFFLSSSFFCWRKIMKCVFHVLSSYLLHLQPLWWDRPCLRPFAAIDLGDSFDIDRPDTSKTRCPPHVLSESWGWSCSDWVCGGRGAPGGQPGLCSLHTSEAQCDPAPLSWTGHCVQSRAKRFCRRRKEWTNLRRRHTGVLLPVPLSRSASALLYGL